MVLVGILGKKRAGKDTISDYLEKKYNFNKIAFATPLKEVCKILFDFSDEQLYGDLKEVVDPNWGMSPRHMMQYLGTDILRKQIKDDMWINIVRNKYLKYTKENKDYRMVISDVRFPNEIKAVHDLSGIVIKVTRPSINNKDQHESETLIDTINDYDFEVINDGTMEDLYNKIDKIINNIVNVKNMY